jgi:hypothetical protein
VVSWTVSWIRCIESVGYIVGVMVIMDGRNNV